LSSKKKSILEGKKTVWRMGSSSAAPETREVS